MKKFSLLFCLFITAFFTSEMKAQVDVSINPIGLLFGDLSVGVDFVVDEKFSIEGSVGFGNNKISGIKGNNLGVNGVGKYYFSPSRRADRFYADVFLRYIGRSWNYDDNSSFADFRTNRVGIGFGIGYKVVSAGNFVFDIGFGAGRAIVDKNTYSDSNGTRQEVDWPNIMFQGKLGLGYRFGGDSKK